MGIQYLWVSKFVCTIWVLQICGFANLVGTQECGYSKKCVYSISVGIQICLQSKLYGHLRFVGKKNVLVVKMWVFKNVGIQKL